MSISKKMIYLFLIIDNLILLNLYIYHFMIPYKINNKHITNCSIRPSCLDTISRYLLKKHDVRVATSIYKT